MTAPVVELRGVSCELGNNPPRPVVRDVSFSVAPGETLVLLGRSGSGKTTTLKLINRLIDPSAGEVIVAGRATGAVPPFRLRRGIGYVIQEVGLLPHLTIADNVGLVPRLEGWESQRIDARVTELLTLVGLAPERFAARRPHELSGGQRQRVGVARALAVDPPLLLLDEPFGALDPITRGELQREFKGLIARLGKAMVFVTHDVREGLLLGTRIGLMQDGRLVFLGTAEEFRRSAEPEVRAFLEAAA
ncbi:MAG TPA: ATP-binding cassette domain-containing protein [Gemmatimonadales bacterium]|nr:ATP-binding cassette domain-containing protein [Gemmatimonadales bacterium]